MRLAVPVAMEFAAHVNLKLNLTNTLMPHQALLTVVANCGDTFAENNTYFESTSATAGACTIKICPCNNNICQLRLDFDTFTITGPSTSSISIGKQIGDTNNGLGKTYSQATQCATDIFSVTNPGGSAPPSICGTNTGQHCQSHFL